MATFAELLRTALTETGVSQRRLGFLIAEATETQPDSARRDIVKWLAGDGEPGPERAELVAELLERPELARSTRQRRFLLRGLVATVEKQQQTIDELVRRVEALERGGEGTQRQQGGR